MKNLTVEEIQQVIKEKIPANLIVADHTETGHFYKHSQTGQRYASVTTKCGILDSPHLKKWASRLAVEYLVEKMKPGDIIPGRIIELKDSAILAHQDEFEQAGDIGTRGHHVIEEYLKEWMATKKRPSDIRTFIKDEDSRIFAIARSAEKFFMDFDVIPIASEMLVASTKHKFAGTLDALMMVTRVTKKGSTACDIKDMFNGHQKTHNYWFHSTTNKNKVICKDCGQEAEREFSLVDFKTSNSIWKVEYAMQTSAYWQALKEMAGLAPKRIYVVRFDKKEAKYEVGRLNHRPSSFKAFQMASKLYDWLENGQEKLVKAYPREQVEITNNPQNNEPTTGIVFQEIRTS